MEETLYDEQAIEYYYEEIMETYGDDEEVSRSLRRNRLLKSLEKLEKRRVCTSVKVKLFVERIGSEEKNEKDN
ncbi:MAG: hypothetical protein ACLUR5_10535 [Eubacterium ventriosum]